MLHLTPWSCEAKQQILFTSHVPLCCGLGWPRMSLAPGHWISEESFLVPPPRNRGMFCVCQPAQLKEMVMQEGENTCRGPRLVQPEWLHIFSIFLVLAAWIEWLACSNNNHHHLKPPRFLVVLVNAVLVLYFLSFFSFYNCIQGWKIFFSLRSTFLTG